MSKSKGRKLAEWLRGLDANSKASSDSIKAGSITTAKLDDGAVTTAKLDDLGVTFGKLHTALVVTESGGIGNNDNDSTVATSAAIIDYVSANSGGIALTDLSVGTPNSASGSGAISYSNSTGVFKYTPPDLSSYLTSITSSDVTTALGFTPTSYTNSSVDSHLNTSTATSNQVLAWTGSDYDWVAQSSGWSGGTLSANILLNTTGSATSSTSYPSYSLILRGQGWDTNGSYASNVDWYIRNETIASVYPDSDLVFYEQDPSLGHYKVKFHGRGSGANYLDQAAASFYGDVSINQTVDSTGGSLTISNIPEIGGDWNPVVLEDSGVIKKDSAVLVHGSGYLQAAYLNMTHGSSGSTSDTVFYSSGDNYIRKNTAGGFVGSLLNATSNPSLTTTHDVHFRNYVYNSTGGTPTRGGFGYHVYQCWSQNCSVNVTDSSWVRGDIIEFNNVRGAVNITVTGSRIYMPNGSHDTVVTWNGTKGGFKLMKYSSNTGYWMVAL